MFFLPFLTVFCLFFVCLHLFSVFLFKCVLNVFLVNYVSGFLFVLFFLNLIFLTDMMFFLGYVWY